MEKYRFIFLNLVFFLVFLSVVFLYYAIYLQQHENDNQPKAKRKVFVFTQLNYFITKRKKRLRKLETKMFCLGNEFSSLKKKKKKISIQNFQFKKVVFCCYPYITHIISINEWLEPL